MRTTTRKRRRKPTKLLVILIISSLIIIGGSAIYYLLNSKDDSEFIENNRETENTTEHEKPHSPPNENEEEVESTSRVRLAAIGDIMFHEMQLISAYDSSTNSYNFKPMFKDVKPYLSDTDITIANFETTLAGPSKPYTGFPIFNSPDEVADAILDAGVDILTTVNNHSLDTGSDGLKRTVNVLQEKGFKTVGTYSKNPESRVLFHEVNDITFGIIAYTSSTNGLGKQYSSEELNSMLNLMTKENIERDITEAQKLDVDFLIAFMHWGEEYETDPNETQIDFANFMAEKGVDLILGSHPHVIQKSDTIKTEHGETYVIYSMGNFISNQRKETLGDGFELTEDGIIAYFNIEKNDDTKETVIKDVEFTPTWVYRDGKDDSFIYRVLPIEDFLADQQIAAPFKKRMERSFEATMKKMNQ